MSRRDQTRPPPAGSPEGWEEPQGAARQALVRALARLVADDLAEDRRLRDLRRPSR